MGCLVCRHLLPHRVASMANAAIVRWRPCLESDFQSKDTVLLPITDDDFVTKLHEYKCDKFTVLS